MWTFLVLCYMSLDDSTFSFSWLSWILLSRRSGWREGQVDHPVSTPKEELLVGPWGGGGFAPHWAITDISLGDSRAWKTYDALLVLPIWLPLPPWAGMVSLLLDSGECPDPATLGFLRPHPTGGESKQTVAHPHIGILPGNNQDELMKHATTWVHLRGIMVSERSPTRKVTRKI